MERLVDIERIFFQRLRFGEVPQVLEHAFDLLELAFDRAPEALAILEIIEHLDDQFAAVADVLNRMRDVVDEADRDTPERSLPLFLADIFLQLDEPIRHVVEGVAELPELVGGRDGDSFVEIACGERACSASKGQDGVDEAATPEIADSEHREQGESDGDFELTL